MSTNEMQVGGQHYKVQMEHWDWVEAHKIGYLEGCATKYITRHRKKDGLKDLQKAQHYVEKMLELFLNKRRVNSGLEINDELMALDSAFCSANELTPEESHIVLELAYWSNLWDLESVIEQIKELITKCK